MPRPATSERTGSLLHAPSLERIERALSILIGVLFAVSFHRLFITNINWDEFFYLSFIHDYQRGVPLSLFQTFHVHLFGWLTSLPGNEIHQILAARGVAWLLMGGSSWFIYAIARKYCSRLASLVAVLLYLSFSYVMDHGLSFRADPICAVLFMAALYFLLHDDKSRFHLPISAVLMAVAMMISIKSVFYLPTFGIIFLARVATRERKWDAVKGAILFSIVFGGAFLTLYQSHSLSLADSTRADPAVFLASVGSKMLLGDGWFPRLQYLVRAGQENLIVWGLLMLGAVGMVRRVVRREERESGLVLLALLVPIGSLVIYRNAFPYFFVFLMPAAVVLGGVGCDLLLARGREIGTKIYDMMIVVVLFAQAGVFLADYAAKFPDQTIAQRETIDLVHRMFPRPVAYVDRSSMVPSHRKVGFFMSTWGMESYRARGEPVMEEVLKSEEPKFLIVNSWALDISEPQLGGEAANAYKLLDEDHRILRENFVHHWGAVYVAGKQFDLRPSRPETFEVLISGVHTVESPVPVAINGAIYQPGERVELDRGMHRIASAGGRGRVVLRWGDRLYRPDRAPSPRPIFYGF